MLTPKERLACALYACGVRPESLQKYLDVRGDSSLADIESIWSLEDDHPMRLPSRTKEQYLKAASDLMDLIEGGE